MSFRIGEAFVEVTAEDNTDADISGIGGKLAKWAGGLGLGALIGKSISDGMNIETGVANVQNQLGLTAADAQQYGTLAGNVYRNNFGGSLEEVSSVIGLVGDSMGGLGKVSGAEIEKMTGQVITMSDTFGVDATESIGQLSSAVSSGLAPSLQNATDVATRVFQEGGPKANEFLEIIGEYAPNLKQAGLSMEDFGAMSVSYLDAGGFSVDQFADSIREMTIRVGDGSAKASGAFDTIGLDADAMAAAMAAGGPTAKAAFDQIVGGLAGIEDPLVRQQTGIALFGSMWEDSSGAIMAGLAPVPGALGEVQGATQTMVDVAGGTGAAKIETMKRQLEGLLTGSSNLPGPLGAVGAAVAAVGVETIATTAGGAAMVASFVAQHAEAIKSAAVWVGATAAKAAHAVATGAMTAANGVAAAAQWALNAAMSANPIALVVIAIAALVAGLVYFFTQTELGRQIITAVWGAIQTAIGATVGWITGTALPAIGNAWQWVVDKVTWVKDMYVAIWSLILTTISNAVSSIYNAVVSWIGNVANWWSNTWNAARDLVSAVWSAITTAVSNAASAVYNAVVQWIGNVASWLSSTWASVSSTVSSVWSAIVGFVSSAVSSVYNFISSGISNAVNFITSGFTNARNIVSSVFSSIVSVVSSAISSVVSFITSGISNAVSYIYSGFNSAYSFMASIWNSILSVVSGAISTLYSYVSAIPRNIMNVFSNAGSWLANAGRQIIDGLVNGIKGAIGKVQDTLASVTNLIPDWKGPADVDKVLLKDNGALIMGGLVDGIESQIGLVKGTLGDVTDMIGGTPVGTLDVGSLPGMSAGTTGLVTQRPGVGGNGGSASISIGSLTLKIDGSFDFSNPVEWDRFVEAVRAGLVKVEREYA